MTQGDPGQPAGSLIFNGHNLLHSVRFFPSFQHSQATLLSPAETTRKTGPQPYQLERSFWHRRGTQDPAFSRSQITAMAPRGHLHRLLSAVYYAASARVVQTLHTHKPVRSNSRAHREQGRHGQSPPPVVAWPCYSRGAKGNSTLSQRER